MLWYLPHFLQRFVKVTSEYKLGKRKKKTKGWVLPSLLAAAYPIGDNPMIRVRTRDILGSHYRFQHLKGRYRQTAFPKRVKVGEGPDA